MGVLQSKRILEGDEEVAGAGDEDSERLTDVLPFGLRFVGRRRKKLEDCSGWWEGLKD